MKKYQSGGKTSQATNTPKKEVKSTKLINDLNAQRKQNWEKTQADHAKFLKDKAAKKAESLAKFNDDALEAFVNRRGEQIRARNEAAKKWNNAPPPKFKPLPMTGSPGEFVPYKEGGTIKNQTAMKKQKPAPKKKMSAKEMEAMKKAKTPMMKYGGKMGKKSC